MDLDDGSSIEGAVVASNNNPHDVLNESTDIESMVLSQRGGGDTRDRLFASVVASLVMDGRPMWRSDPETEDGVDALPWVQMRRRMFDDDDDLTDRQRAALWSLALAAGLTCPAASTRPRLLPSGTQHKREALGLHLRLAMAVQADAERASLRTLDPHIRARAAALATPYVISVDAHAPGDGGDTTSSSSYPVRCADDSESVTSVTCDPMSSAVRAPLPLAMQRLLSSTPSVYWSSINRELVDPGDEVDQRGVLIVPRRVWRSRTTPLVPPGTKVFDPTAYVRSLSTLKTNDAVRVMFDFPVKSAVGTIVPFPVQARVGSAVGEWITLDFPDGALLKPAGDDAGGWAPLIHLRLRRGRPFASPFFVYGSSWSDGPLFSRSGAMRDGATATLIPWMFDSTSDDGDAADIMAATIAAVTPGPVQWAVGGGRQVLCLEDALHTDDHPSADATTVAMLGCVLADHAGHALSRDRQVQVQVQVQGAASTYASGLLDVRDVLEGAAVQATLLRRIQVDVRGQALDGPAIERNLKAWTALTSLTALTALTGSLTALTGPETAPEVPQIVAQDPHASVVEIGMLTAANESYDVTVASPPPDPKAHHMSFMQAHLSCASLSASRRAALVRAPVGAVLTSTATEFDRVTVRQDLLAARVSVCRAARRELAHRVASAGMASLGGLGEGVQQIETDAFFGERVCLLMSRPDERSFTFSASEMESHRRRSEVEDGDGVDDAPLLQMVQDDLAHYRRARDLGDGADAGSDDGSGGGEALQTQLGADADGDRGKLLDALLDAAGVVGVARGQQTIGKRKKTDTLAIETRRLLLAAAVLYDPDVAGKGTIQAQMRRHLEQVRRNRADLMRLAVAKGQGGDYALIEKALIAGIRRRVTAAFVKHGIVGLAALLVVLLDASARAKGRASVRLDPSGVSSPHLDSVTAAMHVVVAPFQPASRKAKGSPSSAKTTFKTAATTTAALLKKRVEALEQDPPIGLLGVLTRGQGPADVVSPMDAPDVSDVPWQQYRPLLGRGFEGALGSGTAVLATMQSVLKGQGPLGGTAAGSLSRPNSCCLEPVGPNVGAETFFFRTTEARQALDLAVRGGQDTAGVINTVPPGRLACRPVKQHGGRPSPTAPTAPTALQQVTASWKEVRMPPARSVQQTATLSLQMTVAAYLSANPSLQQEEAVLVRLSTLSEKSDAIQTLTGPAWSGVVARVGTLWSEVLAATGDLNNKGAGAGVPPALQGDGGGAGVGAASTARDITRGFLCVDVMRAIASIGFSDRDGRGGVRVAGREVSALGKATAARHPMSCTGDVMVAELAARLATHDHVGEADALRSAMVRALHGSTNRVHDLGLHHLIGSATSEDGTEAIVRASAVLQALVALSLLVNGVLRPAAASPRLAASVARPLAAHILAGMARRVDFDMDDEALRGRISEQREADKQHKLFIYSNLSDEDKAFMKEYKKVREYDWDDMEDRAMKNMVEDAGEQGVAARERLESAKREEEQAAVDFFRVGDEEGGDGGADEGGGPSAGEDHRDDDDTMSDADGDVEVAGEEGGIGETDD